MSRLYYFASDTELGELKNPNVELLSVNEALARGMDIDTEWLSGLDPDKPGVILFCPEGESLWPNIYAEDKNTFYDDIGTRKRFCAVLEWPYEDGTADVVLEYIRRQLETAEELELWSVWLGGERVEAGPQAAKMRRCRLGELDIDRLRAFCTDEDDYHCLTITR